MISAASDTIAAQATAFGTAALAVIRTSGPEAIDITSRLAAHPERVLSASGYSMVHTYLVEPDGSTLDEVVLAVYRAPQSYTGEDMVEVFCHGSVPGVQRLLAALYGAGMRPADPGEFTMRAFVAGKLDLTRAEAVHEVVTSQTGAAHARALDRLEGSVYRRISAAKDRLVAIMANLAVQIDYPEEDTGEVPIPIETIVEARNDVDALVATYRVGRLYDQGATIALAGRTNAGKSSLYNVFLKQERAIVSPEPGTTRDYIESTLELEGVPVRLVDTAGLRDTREAIESEGIERTRRLIRHADLVLYLVDGRGGLDPGEDLPDIDPQRLIRVWTKSDDPRCAPPPEGYLAVSSVTAQGFAELVTAIGERLVPEADRAVTTVIDSLRQKQLLERASSALGEVLTGVDRGVPVDAISLDVQDAIHALGEITGEVTSADILDAVFGTFCLGK